MGLWKRAASTSKPGSDIKRCDALCKTGTDHVFSRGLRETWSVPAFLFSALELVVHRFARRAVGSEAALGVARALAGEQHGGAARAVLGMDDLRRLQQAEKGLDRRGREELGGEGFLDAIDLGRVQQRIAQAVDAGAESPWRAIAVGGPPELGAVR